MNESKTEEEVVAAVVGALLDRHGTHIFLNDTPLDWRVWCGMPVEERREKGELANTDHTYNACPACLRMRSR